MFIRIFYLFIDSKVKFSSTKNKILRFDLTIMLPCSLRCKFMYKHNTDRYVYFFFVCRYMGRHVFRYENMLRKYLFHLLRFTTYIRRVLNLYEKWTKKKYFPWDSYTAHKSSLCTYNKKKHVIRKEPQRNYSIKT